MEKTNATFLPVLLLITAIVVNIEKLNMEGRHNFIDYALGVIIPVALYFVVYTITESKEVK